MIQNTRKFQDGSTTVYVSLRTQYENLGDELINALLIKQLSKYTRVIVLTYGVPVSFRQQVISYVGQDDRGVVFEPSMTRFSARFAASLLSGTDAWLCLSPGDNTRSGSWKKTWFLLGLSTVFRRFRLIQIGASLSQISPPQSKLFRAASSGHALTVRDMHSFEQTTRLCHSVVPDLAFLLPRRNEGKRDLAVFSFRGHPDRDHDHLVERLRPIVSFVRSAGLRPVITWQVAFDRDICTQLSVELGIEMHMPSVGRLQMLEAKELYARASVIISNRLHVLLLGASEGAVPFGPLRPGENKITGVFELAGLENFISHTASNDETRLAALMQQSETQQLLDRAFATQSAQISSFMTGVFGAADE